MALEIDDADTSDSVRLISRHEPGDRETVQRGINVDHFVGEDFSPNPVRAVLESAVAVSDDPEAGEQESVVRWKG